MHGRRLRGGAWPDWFEELKYHSPDATLRLDVAQELVGMSTVQSDTLWDRWRRLALSAGGIRFELTTSLGAETGIAGVARARWCSCRGRYRRGPPLSRLAGRGKIQQPPNDPPVRGGYLPDPAGVGRGPGREIRRPL